MSRIAVVGACPYPVAQGSQVYLTETARVWQELGHEAHLVVYDYGTGEPPSDLKVHRAPVGFHGKISAGPSWAKPIQDWRMVRALKRILAQEQIDVIDAHNYEGLMVALATGFRPIIYHAHNAMVDELPSYRGFRAIGVHLGRYLDRRYPRQADHVVVPHDRLADYLYRCGCDDARMSIIPPSINPKLFSRVPDREHSPCVLYTGNLDAYQNPEMLQAVMEGIVAVRPGTRCIVATAAVQDLSWADVEVVTGERSMVEALRRDAVFVCPRTSWSGYPIKLLNAMAAGLPVVACAGAAHPMLQGDTGIIVPDYDVDAMVHAVCAYLDNAELRRTHGMSGRRRSFELYEARDMMRDVLDRVLS